MHGDFTTCTAMPSNCAGIGTIWSYYKNGAVKDPAGPVGSGRVTRGGGWPYPPVFCRAAFRSWVVPDDRTNCIGFRVVLVSPR